MTPSLVVPAVSSALYLRDDSAIGILLTDIYDHSSTNKKSSMRKRNRGRGPLSMRSRYRNRGGSRGGSGPMRIRNRCLSSQSSKQCATVQQQVPNNYGLRSGL